MKERREWNEIFEVLRETINLDSIPCETILNSTGELVESRSALHEKLKEVLQRKNN